MARTPSLPDDVASELLQGFGRVEAAIAAHDKRDDERHDDVCERLKRLEVDAIKTGQHQAVLAAGGGVAVKAVYGLAGIAAAGLGAAVYHALGWK